MGGDMSVSPERCDAAALDGRVDVDHAEAEGAARRVHDDVLDVHAHVAQEDVKLLGQVDVRRRLRNDLVRVGQAARRERAVVVRLGRAEEAVLAGGGLRALGKHVVVHLVHVAAPHDEGQAACPQDALHVVGALLGTAAFAVGVRGSKVQADHVGAPLFAPRSPLSEVARHVGDVLAGLGVPVVHAGRVDLEGEGGRMRIAGLKAEHGQPRLAADRDRTRARAALLLRRADGHGVDRSAEPLLHVRYGHQRVPSRAPPAPCLAGPAPPADTDGNFSASVCGRKQADTNSFMKSGCVDNSK